MMISTQVIRELINVFFKRSQLEAASPLFEYVRMVLVPCVGDIDELALAKSGALTALENGVSYYDALILEAATMTNCSILYSEDFQHGRTYGSVQVINPFA